MAPPAATSPPATASTSPDEPGWRSPLTQLHQIRAIEGLSEALSFEMGTIGVKVKIVEPGVINTDFGGRSFDFNNDESFESTRTLCGRLLPSLRAPTAWTCSRQSRSWFAAPVRVWNHGGHEHNVRRVSVHSS